MQLLLRFRSAACEAMGAMLLRVACLLVGGHDLEAQLDAPPHLLASGDGGCAPAARQLYPLSLVL